MAIRLILADDHPVVRQGLRRMLETDPDFDVVAEAENGLEAVALVDQYKPDVLIVDLMMPGLNGLEVTKQVVQCQPDIKVIVLSMHQDEAYVLQAVRRGARGYVLKDSHPNELSESIRTVCAGGRYFSPKLNERLGDKLPGSGSRPSASAVSVSNRPDLYETLTEREREVLTLILKGKTSAEIAKQLTISPRTVEVHRANIMHKLDLSSQIELIRYAIKRGILPVNQ